MICSTGDIQSGNFQISRKMIIIGRLNKKYFRENHYLLINISARQQPYAAIKGLNSSQKSLPPMDKSIDLKSLLLYHYFNQEQCSHFCICDVTLKIE